MAGVDAGERVRRVVLDRPWAVVLVLALVAVAWWGIGTRSQDHHVRVAFDQAVNLVPGVDVQAAGVDVGKVSKVQYAGGQAIVELGIDDGAAWPLHQGTVATLRFGSTAGNGNRRVELTPGPLSAPVIPDGGVLGQGGGHAPTEIDQVLNVFDAPTRKDLATLLRNTGTALTPSAPDLNRGLRRLAPAVRSTGAVMRDLADSRTALSQLLHDGARATAVLDRRRTRIADLVDVTSQTFDVFARNATDVQRTIDALPGTFRQATGTLARLNPTLASTQRLLTSLDPGLRRLPALARVSNPALRNLRSAAADGAALADTAQDAAPVVTRLLGALTPLAQKLDPAVTDLRPMVHCLTPYLVDLTGLLSGWAGYTQEYDTVTHYARARIMEPPTTFQENPLGAKVTTSLGGLTYNGLPAPGAFAGQPSYMPECGVDKAAADVDNDWDAKK